MNDIVQFVMRLTLLWTNLDLLTWVPTTSDNVCYYVFVMITIIVMDITAITYDLLYDGNYFIITVISFTAPQHFLANINWVTKHVTRRLQIPLKEIYKAKGFQVSCNSELHNLSTCMHERSKQKTNYLTRLIRIHLRYHLPRYLRT